MAAGIMGQNPKKRPSPRTKLRDTYMNGGIKGMEAGQKRHSWLIRFAEKLFGAFLEWRYRKHKRCLYCGAEKCRDAMAYFPPAGYFCNLEEYELFRWLTRPA